VNSVPFLPANVRAAIERVLPDFAPRPLSYAHDAVQYALAHHGGQSLELEARRTALQVECQSCAEQFRATLEDCLQKMNPRVALDPELVNKAAGGPQKLMLAETGLNRFMWVIGTGAKGQDSGLPIIRTFTRAAASWVAARHCLSFVMPRDDTLPMNIASNARLEEMRRHLPAEMRFLWISELILESTAEVIAEDESRFGSLCELTPTAIQGLFELFRSLASNPRVNDLVRGMQEAPAGVQDLARALSAPASSLSGLAAEALVASTEIERFPFVDFVDAVVPLGFREAAFHTEQALFEMVRRRLPNEKARGDLFEAVITRCMRGVAPPPLRPLQPPLAIAQPQANDPGEVDFALYGDQLLLVGEAKAYFVTRTTDSVINAFGDQMGKAVKQLDRRIRAFKAGSPLITGDGPIPTAQVRRIAGIAVPLHSYATAVWNAESLEEVEAKRPDLLIMPLHQLILAMQTMLDTKDLRKYLLLRWHYIRSNYQLMDEADLLRVHIAAPAEYRDWVLSEEPVEGYNRVLQPYGTTVEFALGTKRPTNRSAWRQLLFENSTRV
jgi:hypothetical protein